MIQRVQTIWLLLASACAFLTLRLSFFSCNKLVNNVKQFESLTAATANGNLILLIFTVAVAIASAKEGAEVFPGSARPPRRIRSGITTPNITNERGDVGHRSAGPERL